MAGSGSVKFTDRTPDVIREVSNLTGDALEDYTERATEMTKRLAPVRKVRGGNHRDSITYETTAQSIGGKIKGTRLFSQSGYGAYLELGTSKMAARPHFSKALRQAISLFQSGSKWGK